MSRTIVGSLVSERPADSSRTDLWVLGVISAGALAFVAYVATVPVVDLTQRTTDDSYYYFKTARNIVAGLGPTFDGINRTNGFHPLWMAMLLPFEWLAHGDSVLALRIMYAFVGVVAGTTLWAAYRTATVFSGRSGGVIAVCAMLGPWFLNPVINGLETGILILQLFLLMWAAHRYDLLSLQAEPRKNVFLGLMLAILFLCRLDSIFVVLAVFGVIGVRGLLRTDGDAGPGKALVKLFQVGFSALIVVTPYLLWNLMSFGHLVPVSGAIKSTFPDVSTYGPYRFVDFHTRLGTVELAFSLVVLALFCVRRILADNDRAAGIAIGMRSDILIAVFIGCVVHYINTMAFMNWAAWWWHFSSYTPMVVVLGAMLFDRMRRALGPREWFTFVAVASVMALNVFGQNYDLRRRGSHHVPWYNAAIAAGSELPEGSVIGMTDCGLFGYFCKYPTVNLDGVINGFEYQKALSEGRLGEYLSVCGITHIADYEVSYKSGQYRVKLPARLFRKPGGAIVGTPEAEVYRSSSYGNAFTDDIHFAIWSLSNMRVIDDVSAEEDGEV